MGRHRQYRRPHGIKRFNISEATWDHVKDHFETEPRDRVAAKNKGEVQMYFVNARREQTD